VGKKQKKDKKKIRAKKIEKDAENDRNFK
jgi:hypothetical protein